MSGSILTIENITVETRRQGECLKLVNQVSLDLHAGEVVALIGASGSGKSLTCAASLDVLPPGTHRVAGAVKIDGVSLPPAHLRGRQIAMIMQNPRSAFNPVRTMQDHANETFKALGIVRSEWNPRIVQAMRDAGLSEPHHILGLHPFEMSGGMLQRMMIALALASEAPFLFADEPTTDLDLIVQREVLDLLERLRREHYLGILLVTHDMGVVARLADRVVVIEDGRIIDAGLVHDIFQSPSHPTTRRLVNAHLSLYPLEGVA